MWKPESDSSRDAHDHGAEPAVRVARAHRLRPVQIEQRVRARLDQYSHLPATREEVRVGRRKLKGVAVGPIPGSSPSTEVYVPLEGRVYQINVYGEKLDAESRRLLLNLEFTRPSRSVDSLELPDAGAPETYRKRKTHNSSKASSRRKPKRSHSQRRHRRQSSSSRCRRRPKNIGFEEGAGGRRAGSSFRRSTASTLISAGDRYTGWTQIGKPNYWNEYTHGKLGYGRCDSQIYTNDKYAIDYPLGCGDVIFSPFKSGTVTFAGRNNTHRDYGILVSSLADNGKYVSLSAHLNSLVSRIRRDAKVTDGTIIGYAGNTGGPDIPVGDPHLHQAYYRYPRYNPDGSPYGGAAGSLPSLYRRRGRHRTRRLHVRQ